MPTDNRGKRYYLDAFGLEKICDAVKIIEDKSYKKICKQLGVSEGQVQRPKAIDLLIGMLDPQLHPYSIGNVGSLHLYEGCLGTVIGGTAPEVLEIRKKLYPTSAYVAQSNTVILQSSIDLMNQISNANTYLSRGDGEFLNYFREEQIRISCKPECGSCLCGKCGLGTKAVSIKEEREYRQLRENMFYNEKGTEEDPGPY